MEGAGETDVGSGAGTGFVGAGFVDVGGCGYVSVGYGSVGGVSVGGGVCDSGWRLSPVAGFNLKANKSRDAIMVININGIEIISQAIIPISCVHNKFSKTVKTALSQNSIIAVL